MASRPLALLLALLLFPGIAQWAGAEDLPCLMCHEDLTKAKVVHPAVEMDCAICHADPHAKDTAELSLVQEQPDLCFQCHEKEPFTRRIQHQPAASGMCTACHNPHSSPEARLLRASPPELCFQCHDAKGFTRAVRHAPVAAGKCLTCHEPHAALVGGLLNAPVGELCSGCHRKQSKGSHVLAGLALGGSHPLGRVPDPRQAGRELSCVSCHQAHSSGSRLLFVDDAPNPRKLCLQCHEKVRIPLY